MIESYANNLRKLTALKLDWGRNDQILGIPHQCLIFSQKLENLGIHHYAEEYLGMHSDKLYTDDGIDTTPVTSTSHVPGSNFSPIMLIVRHVAHP